MSTRPRAWVVTGVPLGEAAAAQRRGAARIAKLRQEGKEPVTMRHRVGGQVVKAFTDKIAARAYVDELLETGRYRVTMGRWKPRGAPG